MGNGFGDLIALARCWRMAAGLVSAVTFACRTFRGLARAYEEVVAPIVERTVHDERRRVQVNSALHAMSTKIGLAMLNYARLAGCGQPFEISALAGAVTRLYDDLIDSGGDDASIDARLSDLFTANPFAADSDLEALLAELVYEIAHRIHPLRTDQVLVALNTLHEYQCLSRRQREETIPPSVLQKICLGKGAMANLTLCGLVKTELDITERELVMALGETFQALDDYMDAEQDRRNGVTTLVTLGEVTLIDIGQRMRALRIQLALHYGQAATRRYCGMIYFLLLKSAVGRRLPVIGRIMRRLAARSGLLAFLVRGAEVPLLAYHHGWEAGE